MRTTKRTKRAELHDYLATVHPVRITEEYYRALLERLAPVSARYLRNLLRSCGIPLDPLVEGIRQNSFSELERTLVVMAEQYRDARMAGDRERQNLCRKEVLVAKQHARLCLKQSRLAPEVAAQKKEMMSWMTVWLDNPELFPVWCRLRKKVLFADQATSPLPDR